MAHERHDRESVTTLALDLLDRVGLPDLSMRRLATELAVQPSALYWHFASKQELLAAVADRILERPLPAIPAGADPTDRLLHTARGIRDALLAYRDGAEVVLSAAAMRLGGSRAEHALRDALSASAPDAANAAVHTAATAVLQFVLGHTTLVQQRMHAESYGAAAPSPIDDSEDAVFDAGIRMLGAGFAARTAHISK